MRAGQLVSPRDPAVFEQIGNILLHLGLFEPAIKECDNAIPSLRHVWSVVEVSLQKMTKFVFWCRSAMFLV